MMGAPGAGVQASNEDDDLAALRHSFSEVLTSTCPRLAVHQFFDRSAALDVALWSQAAELGWLGLPIGEDLGGLGLGADAWSALHRELGRVAAPGAFISSLAGAYWIAEWGSEEHKARFARRVVTGKLKIATPALPLDGPALQYRRGRLSGALQVLGPPTSGLVIAPVEGEAHGAWAMIEPPVGSLAPIDLWDRTRDVCSFSCDAAEPVAIVPDPAGLAARALTRHMCLALASDSLGAAAGLLAQTVEYLKTRVQFGRPIGSFQALKHRAADHVASLSLQEALLEQAVQASGGPDGDLWNFLAKADITDACATITADCIQLHGGIGHTWEYDVHIFVKRTKLNQVLGGANTSLRDASAQLMAEAAKAGRTILEFEP